MSGRVCECGSEVSPGRHGRWCSSWCQARSEQGLPPSPPPGLAPPVRLDVGRGASVDVPGRVVSPVRGSLVEQVSRRLEAAGVLDSWEGSAAVDLASAIGGASGSARAALHRELRSLMRDALRGLDDVGSSVGGMRDELKARRERRAGGAG